MVPGRDVHLRPSQTPDPQNHEQNKMCVETTKFEYQFAKQSQIPMYSTCDKGWRMVLTLLQA